MASLRAQTAPRPIRPTPGPAAQNLQVLDRHDGPVEELLLPLRGPDTKPVSDRDLQRLDDAPVLHVAADLDNHAFGIRRPCEMALAHEMR